MPRVVWSESAGKRAYGDRPSSVVRVYERADSPGRIYLERAWITGSGRTRALKHGTTREAAATLARKTAAKRQELLLKGRDAFGDPEQTTLFELLRKYHDPKESRAAARWSDRHRKEQERCRRFWKRGLGDVPVTLDALPPAKVEAVVGRAADARDWSGRTEERYLAYLKAASRWGCVKARLIPVDPLMGVEMPEYHTDTRDLVYSVEDARALATPHPEIDWRVTLAFALASVHGRRISAILHLWAGREDSDVESDIAALEVELPDGTKTSRMFLHYQAAYDKVGRDTWVPVPEGLPGVDVRGQIERALEQPEVIESGWLFPEGQLGVNDPRDKPIRTDTMDRKLHEAEKVLGIEYVPGRAYHGGKRLHVTKGLQVAGGDASRVGDITGNLSEQVLRRIYRQRELGQMVAQVDAVSAVLAAKSDTNTDTEEGADSGDP